MEIIRQWAFCICSAAVVGGIVQIITPDSSLGKVFRITLSAFFVLSIAYPLISASKEITLEISPQYTQQAGEDAEEIAEELRRQTLEFSVEALKTETYKKMQEMGIKEGAVAIYIRTEQGEISAQDIQAELTLPKEYEPKHADWVRRLEYELGFSVKIGYQ